MRLVLTSTVVLLVIAAAAGATTAPRLRVVDESPLVIRGTSFKRGETVRVSLLTRTTTRQREVVADPTGGFTVRFTLSPMQCQLARSLTASGSRGSRARLELSLSCWPPPPAQPS